MLFVDFEASSLGVRSYPIEIGWCDEAGMVESHLIRPEKDWTDWDVSSQAIHGISRDMLAADGKPAIWVADRFREVAGSGRLFSDGLAFDQYWLARLLSAGAVTEARAAPVGKIEDVHGLYADACRQVLARRFGPDLFSTGGLREKAAALVIKTVADAERLVEERSRRRHRAGDDAHALWQTWSSLHQDRS